MSNSEKDQLLDLGRSIIQQEIEALEALSIGLDEAFVRVAGLLSGCTGIVWVTAVGTSAAVGTRFAHLLTCCGARSMFISPADGLHGHAGILQPADLLVAMSRGGESIEVNQMAAIANQRKVATVAFVHNTGSTLAHASRLVLPVPSPQEYELMGYLATASTVVYSAMCDALCAVVAKAKGFNPEEFAKIHPGGAVGQVLGSQK